MRCPWSVRRVKGLMGAVPGLCAGLRVRVEGSWTTIKADDMSLLLLFSPSLLPFAPPPLLTLQMSTANSASASVNTSYPGASPTPAVTYIQVSFHL
jgi:hypothetical protein